MATTGLTEDPTVVDIDHYDLGSLGATIYTDVHDRLLLNVGLVRRETSIDRQANATNHRRGRTQQECYW